MGERAHTPGPWTVREYGDGDSLVVHAGEDWRICFMATPGSSPNATPRIEANARLISAAPDMFDALQCLPFGWLSAGVLSHPDADLLTIQLRVAGTVYEHEISVGQLRDAAVALAKAEGLCQRADATPSLPDAPSSPDRRA